MKSLFVALGVAASLYAQSSSNAPNYTAAGIVNGASFAPGLAPNTVITIFGTNLSWDTRTVGAGDIAGGTLPTTLDNVEVYFGGWPAYLYYVSPTQINLLVPSSLRSGTFQLWVARQGVIGPYVTVTLQAAAPALFQTTANVPVATHLNGSLVSNSEPAKAGEIITLWAAGLGPTSPPLQDGSLPLTAQWLDPMSDFSILINGEAIDANLILYAGVAPGYAGLYQVNVQLPDPLAENPEIRLAVGTNVSPKGVILPAK